jgi:isopentenyl-diphosphate delta-isomerase
MTSPASRSREAHLVELVDSEGAATGSASVEEAHEAPGQLHRAFSVFLRDDAGRVLLQQRAATKTRFPLRWGNTCCGHPAPGEDVRVAAARRLVEEVGVGGVALTEVGVYSYYAEDPASGRVEYEYDHVLLGDIPAGRTILPDPDEVAGVRWVPLAELRTALVEDPRSYAPWLSGVAERLAAAVAASPSSAASPPSASSSSSSLVGPDDAAERLGDR